MTERGRLMLLVTRKSVLLPMLIVLALLSLGWLTLFPSKADALINQPINPSNDEITGLWNTGVNNSGNLMSMPAPGDEYTTTPYAVDNNAGALTDPHWRLIDIQDPADGSPHCQTFSGARSAVVIMPPYTGALDPAGMPTDGGYVWWRRSMTDPANVLVNGSFQDRNARWIGARQNSFHDSAGGTGVGQQSNGTCTDNSSATLGQPNQADAWPTFVYELKGGFNVGECVNENTIQLSLYWAADDEFTLVINGTSVPGLTRRLGGGVVSTTPISSTLFQDGINTLEVRVRSSFPLQGFAIGWDEPRYECTRPEPYFKIFGNDIAAGGDFAPTCDLTSVPNARAAIFGFSRSSHREGQITLIDNIRGAGAQMGVFALGQIDGFHSGTLRSPRRSSVPESPVNGLTFGNFGDPLIGPPGGYNWDTVMRNILDPNRVVGDGGKGGQCRGIPDYYSIASSNIGGAPSTANGPFSPSSVTEGFYRPSGGTLELSSASGLTGKHTIVVDGDVYINGNSSYNFASGIPSLYIIAKGNIYIDNSVGDIAGVFVAQPYDTPQANGDPGGTIYTCADGGGAAPHPVYSGSLRNSCNNNLTISGAFIANRIRLLRVNGQVNDSSANEDWVPDDNIAEIFKSSPELYLSAPAAMQKPTNGNVEYDSIQNLPPIL